MISPSKSFYIDNLPADIHIFHHPFWLDIVAEHNWDVAIVRKDGRLFASMPYCFSDKGNRYIGMPPLTQFLGPHYVLPDIKRSSLYKVETEIIAELLKQIPAFTQFSQNWHFGVQNYLPFHWSGYTQTTRYTYLIPCTGDIPGLWNGFKDSLRNTIRNAKKKVTVENEVDIDSLFGLSSKTFASQNGRVPYSYELLQRLVDGCRERNMCTMFSAKDYNDPALLHAAVLVVFDNSTAYYLIGCYNRDIKNSGALSLLVWEAIQFAMNKGLNFDFEGSMLPKVEPFFREFGGIRQNYHHITRSIPDTSRIAHLMQGLRHLKKFIYK